jgi:hypothetical protein
MGFIERILPYRCCQTQPHTYPSPTLDDINSKEERENGERIVKMKGVKVQPVKKRGMKVQRRVKEKSCRVQTVKMGFLSSYS